MRRKDLQELVVSGTPPRRIVAATILVHSACAEIAWTFGDCEPKSFMPVEADAPSFPQWLELRWRRM